MRINFFAKILDHEGHVIREGKTDPNNPNTLMSTREPCDFPTIAAANAVGVAAAMEDGRVVIVKPTMFDMTLQRICAVALVKDWPEEKLDRETAFRRWTLATRIGLLGTSGHEDGHLDLDMEERAIIIAATDNWNGLNRTYFARCREMLDEAALEEHADGHKSTKQVKPPRRH